MPFTAVEQDLHRECNELLPREARRPPPEVLVQEARRLWQEFRSGHPPAAVAEAWSLLESKVQAEALDRAGVPHPPELIPVTSEQKAFWEHFAADGAEGASAPGSARSAALSAEWTAAASVAEALDLAAAVRTLRAEAVDMGSPSDEAAPLVAVVLGPSAAQEYAQGAHVLEAQLATLLGSLVGPGGRSVSIVFCGPEVPQELHGVRRRRGPCTFEHWRALWHERSGAEAGVVAATQEVDVYVALNAGTSVAEYKEPWLRTLWVIAKAGGLVFFTGYTLAEAEDTRRDLVTAAPKTALLACGANRAATLLGPDRVELGVTPASYPGKSNYSRCCAWLPVC